MIGSSKNSTENYPKKWIGTQEKEARVNFNPGLSANRPSNNSAQFSIAHDYRPGMSFPLAILVPRATRLNLTKKRRALGTRMPSRLLRNEKETGPS